MEAAKIYCHTFDLAMGAGPDIADITGELASAVERSGIRNGSLHAFAVGSTGSITTIEYEPGVVEDLKEAVERIAPPGLPYAHERAWHDGNGHSHVQAAILGPSMAVPLRDGRLAMGTWQQVVLINHDLGSRRRRVEVTVMGT